MGITEDILNIQKEVHKSRRGNSEQNRSLLNQSEKILYNGQTRENIMKALWIAAKQNGK